MVYCSLVHNKSLRYHPAWTNEISKEALHQYFQLGYIPRQKYLPKHTQATSRTLPHYRC